VEELKHVVLLNCGVKNPKPMGNTVKCSEERKNRAMLHIGDILDGGGQRQCGRSSDPPPSNVEILWGMTTNTLNFREGKLTCNTKMVTSPEL
jgi:hypothetical protein